MSNENKHIISGKQYEELMQIPAAVRILDPLPKLVLTKECAEHLINPAFAPHVLYFDYAAKNGRGWWNRDHYYNMEIRCNKFYAKDIPHFTERWRNNLDTILCGEALSPVMLATDKANYPGRGKWGQVVPAKGNYIVANLFYIDRRDGQIKLWNKDKWFGVSRVLWRDFIADSFYEQTRTAIWNSLDKFLVGRDSR